MSHTEYSAQFVQYSSVFLGLEEAPHLTSDYSNINPIRLVLLQSLCL